MTHDEFRRWLLRQGAVLSEARRHTKVVVNGRVAFLPRHGQRELPIGTMKAILRQLGLREDEE